MADDGPVVLTVDQGSITPHAGLSQHPDLTLVGGPDEILGLLTEILDTEVETIRALLRASPTDMPVMDAVREAVLTANHYRAEDVPELAASAATRYDAWEQAVIDYVADRTGDPADSLYPLAVGRATLAVCRAAYECWAARADADLTIYLDDALHALAAGFDRGSKTIKER